MLPDAADRDRHLGHGGTLTRQVEQRFLGIGVSTVDIDPEGGVAGVRAEAARRVGERTTAGQARDACHQPVAEAVEHRHVWHEGRIREAGGRGEVGAPPQERSDELGDRLRGMLPVAVQADDDVGAGAQGRINRRSERGTEAPVLRVRHYARTALQGQVAGSVGRAVIRHDHVDTLNTFDGGRHPVEERADGLLLVEREDHYSKLHRDRDPRSGVLEDRIRGVENIPRMVSDGLVVDSIMGTEDESTGGAPDGLLRQGKRGQPLAVDHNSVDERVVIPNADPGPLETRGDDWGHGAPYVAYPRFVGHPHYEHRGLGLVGQCLAYTGHGLYGH